ncbi:MAG: transposase [Acidobacteria bacterium]|nr:transposase [Acidobacteriota bacterium]
MAIVKATYTRSRAGAKASIRYIEHRPGKDGDKITRTLFGIDGLMGRDQAYRLIDEAPKGSIFYRFVVSPDPKKEDMRRDLHLREVTEKTMQALRDRLKQEVAWVAAEHDDHAPNRHVHVVAVVMGGLHPRDFQAMRQRATEAALCQRQEHDLARGQEPRRLAKYQTAPGFAPEFHAYKKDRGGTRLGVLRPAAIYQTCPSCGYRQVNPRSLRVHQCACVSCGFQLHRNHQPRFNIKEVQWER